MLRNRESLCVLKAQGNTLTLNTLRFASEIRPVDELRLPVNEKLAPNEVNLAMKLIEGMTVEFDPAKYHDTYSEDVKKLIDAKAKGAEAPGAAAATCPQQRDRHRRGPAGEPGAKEAEKARCCLTPIRSAALYRGRRLRNCFRVALISRSDAFAASSSGFLSNSASMAFLSSVSFNGKEVAVLPSH